MNDLLLVADHSIGSGRTVLPALHRSGSCPLPAGNIRHVFALASNGCRPMLRLHKDAAPPGDLPGGAASPVSAAPWRAARR
jgi:hypothetical protein